MENENLLQMAEDLELSSKDFGFYWKHISQVMEQIRSECAEVEEAYENNDKTHLQEEIGDIIHAALSLTVFCGMNPYETLKKSIVKYEKRLDKLKEFAKEDGHKDLKGASVDTLMHYWDKAKITTS